MQCNGKIIYAATFAITIFLVIFFYHANTNELKNLRIEDLITNHVDNGKLFDLNFRYAIDNNKCAGKLLAVIIVTSYFGNVETRSAMRRAFPQEELVRNNIQRVFLLGTNYEDAYTKQSAIENEAKRFGDVIQGNFHEAYRNLTYKHAMGLKWVSENCGKTKYVIKMDDDTVINMYKIIKVLKEIKLPKSNLLAGYILKGMKPIREHANKWFVTHEEYSKENYPTFLSGWFYITNPATSAKLIALTKFRPYFWIDDAYITGILAGMIKIRHYNIGEFFTVHPEFLRCCVNDLRSHDYDCEILIGPNGGDNNLFFEFNDAMKKCEELTCKTRPKSLNDTCVAERKFNLGKGSSVIETYKLV